MFCGRRLPPYNIKNDIKFLDFFSSNMYVLLLNDACLCFTARDARKTHVSESRSCVAYNVYRSKFHSGTNSFVWVKVFNGWASL